MLLLLSDEQIGFRVTEPLFCLISRQEAHADGQQTYPAKIHKDDNENLGDLGQPSCSSRGQPHSAQSGGCLIQGIRIGYRAGDA